MCFSAGASFGASAMLGAVGVLTVRKSTSAPRLVLFTAIPLLFSVQQLTEGFVWLSLTNPDYHAWENNAVYSFLFFAEVLWPVWASLSVLLLERDSRRKGFLWVLAAAGLCVSLYFAYHLAFYPVRTSVASHHIRYQQDFPMARLGFGIVFYVIPAVMPFLVSSGKGMWIMGLSILAAYAFAQVLYPDYLASVWCFFAAIISVEVLLIVRKCTAANNAVMPPMRASN
jgi:hypothetical protein